MKKLKKNKSLKSITAFSLVFLCVGPLHAEEAHVTAPTVVVKDNHYSLTNPLHNNVDSTGNTLSVMSYDPTKAAELGAAFSMAYVDIPDGSGGMDGYVQGTIGGVQANNKWWPGDPTLTGMPIQIKDLDNSLRIQWQTFQENAHDVYGQNGSDHSDKWWATINVIFDSANKDLKPNNDDRDFDVVIELESTQSESFEDLAKPDHSKKYWWFARNPDGSIHPFSLTIDGKVYEWAVRYKYFKDVDPTKADKVHVKYIPFDHENIAPYLDHPLKTFTDAAEDYLQYIDFGTEYEAERLLAIEKVNTDSLWIKSMRAGYEVYNGKSTLGNKHFRNVIDVTSPEAPDGLSVTVETDKLVLNWLANSSDDPIEHYTVYRSVDGAAFKLLDVKAYTNQYVDLDVTEGKNYEYYLTATDRSFNTSQDSDVINATGVVTPTPTPTPTPAPVVEETESDTSSGGGSFSWLLVGGLFLLRRRVL